MVPPRRRTRTCSSHCSIEDIGRVTRPIPSMPLPHARFEPFLRLRTLELADLRQHGCSLLPFTDMRALGHMYLRGGDVRFSEGQVVATITEARFCFRRRRT